MTNAVSVLNSCLEDYWNTRKDLGKPTTLWVIEKVNSLGRREIEQLIDECISSGLVDEGFKTYMRLRRTDPFLGALAFLMILEKQIPYVEI